MVKKFLVSVMLLACAAVAATFGFAGLAAWADAQHVCPGSQCDDAHATVLISLLVVPTSFVTGIVALRTPLRS
jgi:hypothetical protein